MTNSIPVFVANEQEHRRIIARAVNELLNAHYGEMYMTNASQVVTVSLVNTAYEVGGGFSAGELNNIEFGGSHYLKVNKLGRYLINWSLSVDTNVANDEIEGGIMINGSTLSPDKGTSHTTVSVTSHGSTLSSSAIVGLEAGDQVSLYIRNHTDADNVTVEHGSLIIRWIGI